MHPLPKGRDLSALAFALLATFLICADAPAAPADGPIALQVGRVIPVAGPEIENATILIENGRIKAIGKNLPIPRDARVISKPDGVALPGAVDVHGTTGLRIPNESLADVPYVTVLDGIDPSSTGLRNSLRAGVTTVHCIPANSTRFGGQGAVIRTSGGQEGRRMVDELVVKSPSGLKLSLSPSSGETRMGNMAALRKRFHDLHGKLRALQVKQSGRAALIDKPDEKATLEALVSLKPDWTQIDWKLFDGEDGLAEKVPATDRVLVDAIRGKLPVWLYVPRATDIFKAFELIETHGLRSTLVLSSDAWKLVDVLEGREGLSPLVLSSRFEVWETDPRTRVESRHITPKLFWEAGIPFTIQVAQDRSSNRGPSFGRSGRYSHWYQCARLVRYGVPRDAALRTVTLAAAEVLGLEHRIGSLEIGKDANIVVFTGDPLDVRSWVDLVLIEGDEAYDRAADPDLERLLRAPERPF